MKVRLKSIMAGPEGVRQPGIHNLPRALALELIKSGQADKVEGEPKAEPEEVEEATDKVAEKRETATAPAQRRRRKKVE